MGQDKGVFLVELFAGGFAVNANYIKKFKDKCFELIEIFPGGARDGLDFQSAGVELFQGLEIIRGWGRIQSMSRALDAQPTNAMAASSSMASHAAPRLP